MYFDFFGLSENPFSIVPAPDYFYLSERHQQALTHLMYSLPGGTGGFVLLTGEVGTGKTTVCRTWLSQLNDQTALAYILNPSVNEIELLETICDEFAIPYTAGQDDLKSLFELLTDYLNHNHQQGLHSVLLIDEAQLLTPLSLELLKLLTQIEYRDQKLLKVVLIGQPELLALLRQESLLTLAQGINTRYHLLPLNYQDICHYVAHRLKVAGCRFKVFSRMALKELQLHSNGVPRIVNLICDQSMLAAFAQGKHQVSARMVRQVANELQGIQHQGVWRQLLEPYQEAISALALGAVIGSAIIGLTPTSTPPALTQLSQNNSWFIPSWQAMSVTPSLAASQQQNQSLSSNTQNEGKDKPSHDQQREFLNKLIAQSHSMAPAMQSLYQIWGYSLPAERADCDTGSIVGLHCVQASHANIAQLKKMNHPVVVKMRDPNQQDYYVTLAKIYRGVELLIAGQHIRVSEDWFTRHWQGEFTLLWKAPLHFDGPLQRGDQGPAVTWLSESLAQLDPKQTQVTDTFDHQLERSLKLFQQQQTLDVDGIAGAQTLLQLNLQVRPNQPKLVFKS
ncbi:ExeA family protein [Motilimonas eburnea]|uniref:ExeA family protein n=1 Tax=Motilimonas eburnea TaxID=1737488 RepID=UPI001E3FF533|nr:ExeA family protein [Motilimonas eburnea]MCE2572295.1 AAA family ATPase [Motilimonas eburnea]